MVIVLSLIELFLSTPSARRATFRAMRRSHRKSHISIHALRKEGDADHEGVGLLFCISIHALRKEGDHFRICFNARLYHISIHALRKEGDVR